MSSVLLMPCLCSVPEVQREPGVLRRGVPRPVHGGGQAGPVRPRVRAVQGEPQLLHRVSSYYILN